MVMRNKTASIILIVILMAMTMVGYTNCSGALTPLRDAALGSSGGGSGGLGSGSGSQAICEQDLRNVFSNSYLPQLRDQNKCGSCHADNGVAPPKFASSDVLVAYSSFRQYGPDLIDANATSTTHAAPKTGAQNATAFSLAHASWNQGLTTYNACVAALPVAGSTPVPIPTADSLMMTARNIPAIYYNAGVAQITEWDMANEVTPANARFSGKFQVDIRVVYATDANGVKTAIGYGFARPRVKLLVGEVELDVDGVVPYVNGQTLDGTEPMENARALARGISYTTIYNGEVIANRQVVSTSDEISFGFRYFKVRARSDNPQNPPTPAFRLAPDYTNNVTVNASVTSDASGNAQPTQRWCLTANPTPVRSAGEPCPGYQAGTTNGWSEARPTSVNLSTLGRNPNSGETVTVYLWVVNSDLKVNATPATDTVVFDSTVPSHPGLSSVSLTSTQIADLNGLGDSNETVQWCINVSASNTVPQGGCNGTYTSTKPSFIGLPFNGLNYVLVYVRDLAGNEARPVLADLRSVTNTYGYITFTQLSSGGTARSVFETNCNACHAAGAAQAAKWTSTDFLNTKATAAAIKSAIEGGNGGTIKSMPPTGLLSAKDRALIKLWFDRPVEY